MNNTHTHTHTPCKHTHTHTHTNTHRANTHTHTHTHVGRGDWHGCEKDSLEIIIEQVRLEDGFKRGGRKQTGKLFQTDGPAEENDFSPIFGGRGGPRFVCRMLAH